MQSLKRHPFPVVAHFEKVIAISFAFPKEKLLSLIPSGLEIDEYHGLGFVTVALVWTRQMRPAGFPSFFGRDFFLAGYRVFTRLQEKSGRRLRGLKILRSETDKRSMVLAGNLFTSYNYHQVTVTLKEEGSLTRLQTNRPDGTLTLDFTLDLKSGEAGLPDGSPFPDWRTARMFAGPMPFTFSPWKNGTFLVIEGRRSEWEPRPISVKEWRVALFDEEPLRQARPRLANAFAVENVSYRWEKGQLMTASNA